MKFTNSAHRAVRDDASDTGRSMQSTSARARCAAFVLVAAAVAAFGAGGIAGAQSDLPSAGVDAPQKLSAVWRSGEVTLSWQPPGGSEGAAVSGYEYRYHAQGDAVPGNWTSIGAGELTLTLDELTDEVAYLFELRALNADGAGTSDTIEFMPLAPRDGDIRFALESDHDGPIEVFQNNTWGKVCDHSFRHQGAVVACRQLGFATGDHRDIESDAETLPGTPFAMERTKCTGCEGRLVDCPHWGAYGCDDSDTVTVVCDTINLGPPGALSSCLETNRAGSSGMHRRALAVPRSFATSTATELRKDHSASGSMRAGISPSRQPIHPTASATSSSCERCALTDRGRSPRSAPRRSRGSC